MSYDLKILKDSPIGYWSFNSTANDLTLNANIRIVGGACFDSSIIANFTPCGGTINV